jgi:SAM-dependent methyltransferase
LHDLFPNWRDLAIHESSPHGISSAKIASESRNYLGTSWYPEIPPGETLRDYRCENLEHQTFPDNSFDLVITQDVLEHVLDPAAALAEIARTLRPCGAHLFTTPWFFWKPTFTRAIKEGNEVRHLAEPDYHVHPTDPKGSLVVTEWGEDFCDFVERASGMPTTFVRMFDRHRGLEGEFLEVFISRKDAVSDH